MPYRIQQVGKLNRGWTARVLEVFFFLRPPKAVGGFGWSGVSYARVCVCAFFDCGFRFWKCVNWVLL